MSKILNIRQLLPALTLACTFGLTAPALAQTAATAPAASTMAPATTPATPSAPTAMAPTSTMTKPAAGSARIPAADEFKTTAMATAHCPSDTVVWSTLSKSKTYHAATSKYYGKTKHGAYVCEKDATTAGFHAAKN